MPMMKRVRKREDLVGQVLVADTQPPSQPLSLSQLPSPLSSFLSGLSIENDVEKDEELVGQVHAADTQPSSLFLNHPASLSLSLSGSL